jgi:NADPH:quinone reductase-like Zn-dependent oxidoreductase
MENEKMRAVVYEEYGSPEVLKIKYLDKPVAKDNEVLVKIFSFCVTTGDCRLRSLDMPGGMKFLARLGLGYNKPRNPIPSMMYSGVIDSIGKGVTKFKIGDEVFGSGIKASAEFMVINESKVIVLKPKNLSFNEAAAVPFGGTSSLIFLRDFAKIKSGQKILVNGASGELGLFAVQFAKYYGCEVTAVCSGKSFNLVKSLGADFLVDYTKSNFTDSGEKYDVIFDTVGKITFKDSLNSLVSDGKFVETVASLLDYLTVLRTFVFGGKKFIAGVAIEKVSDLEFLKNLIEENKIKSVVDKVFSFEDICDAHSFAESGTKVGSCIVEINSLTEDK